MKSFLKSHRYFFYWLCPIIVGSLIRFLVVAYNPHIIIWDEKSFQDLATRLSQGESFGLPFWPPGWPYLIAVLYKIFDTLNHQTILYFNVIISIYTLILFGFLSNRLFSMTIAIVALWLMALMPSYYIANGLLIYEVWMQFLLIISMYVAVGVNWSWQRVILSIVICSLLTLLRPSWLVMPLVLWLTNFTQGYRPKINQLIIMQLGVLILILPWIIYASNIAGRFVPIALQGGLHLWMANNPEATGTHVNPPHEYWDPINESKAREAAIDYIKKHPSHLIRILPAKVWFMFRAEAWTEWFFTATDPSISPTVASIMTRFSDAFYYFVLALSIIGVVVVNIKRWFHYLGALIPLAYGIISQIALFTGQLKYRWPLQFILIMYAAIAIVWILSIWQKNILLDKPKDRITGNVC